MYSRKNSPIDIDIDIEPGATRSTSPHLLEYLLSLPMQSNESRQQYVPILVQCRVDKRQRKSTRTTKKSVVEA